MQKHKVHEVSSKLLRRENCLEPSSRIAARFVHLRGAIDHLMLKYRDTGKEKWEVARGKARSQTRTISRQQAANLLRKVSQSGEPGVPRQSI